MLETTDGHSCKKSVKHLFGGGGSFEGCGQRGDQHCQHVPLLQVQTGEGENERVRMSAKEERVVTEVD